MTPMSSIFASSTGMPSTFKPIDDAASSLAASHIHPADRFSPLSSPAIMPQYTSAPPAAAPQPQQIRALQSLLSQATGQAQSDTSQQHVAAFLQGQRQVLQAMGFGHLLFQPDDLQSNLTRLLHDAGAGAAEAGSSGESSSSHQHEPKLLSSGRGRGASRTAVKSRPSPIIKPLNGRPHSRRTSISNSTYNSPSFPPSVYSSVGPLPMSMSSSAVLEESPSPIDINSFVHSSEPMRPASALQHFSTSDGNRPITPASLMNMSGDINLLAGLSPSFSAAGQPGQAMPELDLSAATMPVHDIDLTTLQAQANSVPPSSKRKAAPAPSTKVKARAPRKAKAATGAFPSPRRVASDHTRAASKLAEPDYADPDMAPEEEDRKTSHKHAEQRRRDSLKMCFEELRRILPYIPPEEDEDAPKRPGEGNVGGQRSGTVDPHNPNKGVSKVALLRKSNEYILKLHGRIARRDGAIAALRARLARLGVVAEFDPELALLELDDMDIGSERGAWPHPRELSGDEEAEMAPPMEPAVPASKRTKRKSGSDAV
jgi:hypothetical protein